MVTTTTTSPTHYLISFILTALVALVFSVLLGRSILEATILGTGTGIGVTIGIYIYKHYS